MKERVLNISEKFGLNSERTRNIVQHIGWSFLFKAGSVLINFLLVPITMTYLGTSNYGVWLTIGSFLSWFAFFDVGLGNGLRNKFAEAKVQGEINEARRYVSTAYFSFGIFSLIIICVFLLLNSFIAWNEVFNAPQLLDRKLSILLPIVFSFFMLQLVLKLIVSIHQADQNHSIENKVQFFSQLVSIIIVWLLIQYGGSSLLLYGSIYTFIPVIVLVVFNLVAFNSEFKDYRPSIKFFNFQYLKSISGLGLSFFITKIGALMLLTTDNFIVAQLYGPESVVPYSVSYKYFTILLILYSILVNPYWSSFTDAYVKKDINWIKNSVRNIKKIWLLIPVGLTIMLLLSDWFYKLWVGEKVVVPFALSLCMALYVLLYTYNQIFNNFINGVGKVRLHLYVSIVIIAFNIPLSIFFAKNLNFGLTGIILGSCVCLLLKVILLPVQYRKLINGTATGLWNR